MNFQGLEFDGVPTDSDIISDDNDSVSSLVDEDVDFNYVYALFHFLQMVDGQVTVDEGEKLTLLDDSNSYWWLVQKLNTNQMGYIPADNIETAFGKLARVNRRKNLKLCKPDPEHMLKNRAPRVPVNNGSRRVVFHSNIVTQVFISSPVTDDEDYDDDYGYDYDYEDDEVTAAEVPDTDEDRAQAAPTAAQHSQAGAGHREAELDHDESDSDDYSYYYSAGGDSETHSGLSGATASESPGARRVSIAPLNMGRITDEIHDDSDSEQENDHSRHDSTLPAHAADNAPQYYLSNEESDDGDSLTGVLSRLSGSHEPQEHGKYLLRILHVSTPSTANASIVMFRDERLGEVLLRGLAVFGLPLGLQSSLALYAKIGPRDLVPLPADIRAVALMDRLRAKMGTEPFPDSGNISRDLCTLLMAEKTVPLSQLMAHATPAEDDPYAGMETGSRSILRTSIAASISEGITSLASNEPLDESKYSKHTASAADSDLVPAERRTSVGPAEEIDSAAGSSSYSQAPQNSQSSEQRGLEASFFVQSVDDDDNDHLPDSRKVVQSLDNEDNDDLPDSRKVVQGLLRSIQPPKSQPSQSAINRAKRNTVQISAQGAVVDGGYQASRGSPPEHRTLSRSASTRGYASTSNSNINGSPVTNSVQQPSNVPSEPVVAFQHGASQALGHSASTLRPSSDTFTQEDSGSDAVGDQQRPSTANADLYVGMPASPTASSDTASTHRDGTEEAAPAAANALTALSHSAPHRLLKDGHGAVPSARDPATNGIHHSDPLLYSTQPMPPDELSLDDWLVILHGWNDMHDISTSTTSFYQSFLKEMQASNSDDPAQSEACTFIQSQVAELTSSANGSQSAVDDILRVSQGVGHRLDALERDLDDIARLLVHAN
ncbi:protein phosphatase regulator [Coemansia guatemalensis]|uniref:Protein phosphatase regulator n=1 Tax=Coemansia guatemalensis TaxID=2761395 RepID=A0A9W8LR82_9FUNG|nr:protein phosphatase regulator [Coemansia guatemalensis]